MALAVLERNKKRIRRPWDEEEFKSVPPLTEPLTRPVPIPESTLPMVETIATRPIEPVIPVPQPPPAPGSILDPNAPLIRYNNKGRPIAIDEESGGDPLANQEALLRAQQGYKAPISKKDAALTALFGFLQRGIPGAIGNVAQYTGNQDYRNQYVMGGDIANTQDQLQRGLITRKQANELLNDQSTRGYRDAQAQELVTRANRPPKSDSKFIERPDGVYEVSVEHPEGRKVGNIPAEAKRNANPTRYFERPDGVYGINDDHPEGFKVPGVPGTPDKSDSSGFTNAQIESNIQEAKSERDRIGESLKIIPPTVETIKTDPYTLEQTKVNAPNPAYTDLMSRYRKLDDDIRDWRTKVKPPVLTRSSGKTWSASRWKAANPNGDVEAAKKAATAKGFQVTE